MFFLAATWLPAAALVWLGWRLVLQDAALEAQRVQDLLDHGALEVASGLNRDLSALERDLPSWSKWRWEAGVGFRSRAVGFRLSVPSS